MRILLVIVILLIILFVIRIITTDYDKCYSEREYEGYAAMGCCKGLVGGTSATDYLSESCVECPYLVLTNTQIKRKENEKCVK